MGSPGRVIFIGNISFDLSEQQITDVFKDIGPIISFKLMFDRETGKPRGFAFCEYADMETANSAIRNLNGYEINGRVLKVDYADQDVPVTGGTTSNGGGAGQTQQQPSAGLSPSLSATSGTPFLPVINTTQYTTLEAINTTLAGLSNQQLHELLMHAKNLSLNDPAQAKAFLEANPAVSYALLQSLLLMNAIDPRIAQQILGGNLQKGMTSQQASMGAATSAGAATKPGADSAAINKEQQEMLEKILALSDEQISALSSEQQSQVRAIKAQFSRK
jgi:cleavage stimulation factor subunit 2